MGCTREPRVGLVSTFRFPVPVDKPAVERYWLVIDSFVLYHLTKGFDHIFLYSDDPEGGSDGVYVERIQETFSMSQVSVRVRNEEQRDRQSRNCRLWDKLGAFYETDVHARQTLNAEEALNAAAKIGLNWLLHIDIDELFYSSEASIKPHFSMLEDLGVEQMTYANHEGVPCREDVSNFFTEVGLFRINHLVLSLSGAVGECMEFWRRRRKHGQYLLAYDNGKSAVSVQPGTVLPESVHRWRRAPRRVGKGATNQITPQALPMDGDDDAHSALCKDGSGLDEGTDNEDTPLVSRTALADPRDLNVCGLLECQDPCVLHYINCGLDWLWDKYSLLGAFPSSWYGGRLPIAPCFHLDARDVVAGGGSEQTDRGLSDRSGGERWGWPTDKGCSKGPCISEGNRQMRRDRAADLYHKQVMLCPIQDKGELRKQLKCGVLREIKGPASVIKAAQRARDKHHAPSEQMVEEEENRIMGSGVGRSGDSGGKRSVSPFIAGGAARKNDPTVHSGAGCQKEWILASVARDYL
ncbi:unnamed protein product [Discosporangium mesarthrocarpum]